MSTIKNISISVQEVAVSATASCTRKSRLQDAPSSGNITVVKSQPDKSSKCIQESWAEAHLLNGKILRALKRRNRLYWKWLFCQLKENTCSLAFEGFLEVWSKRLWEDNACQSNHSRDRCHIF